MRGYWPHILTLNLLFHTLFMAVSFPIEAIITWLSCCSSPIQDLFEEELLLPVSR